MKIMGLVLFSLVLAAQGAQVGAQGSQVGRVETTFDKKANFGAFRTYSWLAGYKASNPVVSDDGKFIAFQMARSREAAGVGHGIFVYDLEKSKKAQP